MINQLENLPNEIILIILSNLKWFEMIESFWLLNKRFKYVICLKISLNNNRININENCLSLKKCYSILSTSISNSLYFFQCIKSININGTNLSCCNIISQWIFSEKNLCFINLKKLILIKCYLTEVLIKNLSMLIENQLDELILTFDKDIFSMSHYERTFRMIPSNQESKSILMIKEFLCKLFSIECKLTSLEVDLSSDETSVNIHHSFLFPSDIYSNIIDNGVVNQCINLRYLHIHLIYGYIVEHIIQHTPALQTLSIQFKDTLINVSDYDFIVKKFPTVVFNWYEKIPKLKYFMIKSVIIDDSELNYLKWILNKVNYIEKLKVRLDIKNSTEDNNIIDGNTFSKYFLPDISTNLLDFDFYIVSKCKFPPSNNIQTIINSFKIEQFFLNHPWINVNCFFDQIMSCQHLSSSTTIIKPKFFDGIIGFRSIFHWKHIEYIKIDICPTTSLLLKQFDVIFPHINWIKFDMGRHKPMDEMVYSTFLESSLDVVQCKLTDIHLRHVTRLTFGFCFYRGSGLHNKCSYQNMLHAEVLAYLISMPTQLIYLRIEQFEWLLHLIKYASDKIRKNALSSVRHVEFCLLSCNSGSNKSIHMGRYLVPFLSNYMPYLQTLRLWRDDDFPWTSMRPEYRAGHYCHIMTRRWIKSLRTSESINQHVTIFEQNLCELVEKLKELIYLDIYGQTYRSKIEPYRSMVQRCFPNSRLFIDITRFRLWF